MQQPQKGARGPINDFYDAKEQEYIKGELTSVGMRQHFLLGKEMRKEFIEERKFLSDEFLFKEMEIYSSNVNRTIQSAYSNLYGFYPLNSGPSLKENMKSEHLLPPFKTAELEQQNIKQALPSNFQTTPVMPTSDRIMLFSHTCPNKQQLQDSYAKNQEKLYNFVWEKYGKPLAEKCNKIFNQEFNNLHDLKALQSNIFSDVFQNRSLPQELTEELQTELKFIYNFEWIFTKSTGQLNKVMSTELMKFIVKNMQKKMEKQEKFEKKYIKLSGHDSNLVQVMGALELTSPECILERREGGNVDEKYINCLNAPPYASQFLFELYSHKQKEHNYYIKVRFNNEYVNLCGKKNVICDFKEFSKRISHYIVEDPWRECLYSPVEKYAHPMLLKQYNLVTRQDQKNLETQDSPSFVVQYILIVFLSLSIIRLVYMFACGGKSDSQDEEEQLLNLSNKDSEIQSNNDSVPNQPQKLNQKQKKWIEMQ